MLLPTEMGTLIGDMVREMIAPCDRNVLVMSSEENKKLISDHVYFARVYVANTHTMSETLLAARDYIDPNANVLMGMPDSTHTGTWPIFPFTELAREIEKPDRIAVAGCWKARSEQRGKLGLVWINGQGLITEVVDKRADCNLDWAWGVLAWKPAFWKYIVPAHPHVGYALAGAIKANERVASVQFEGDYWDCGTRSEYFKLCARWAK
jgi:UTP-glucose-1-phosphate uridylyltransferase